MSRLLICSCALLFGLLSSCQLPDDASSPEQISVEEQNKKTVLNFYRDLIGRRDESLVDQYITDSYIQHNPMVKTGKAGFLETLEFLKQMPPADTSANPILRILAESNLVALHLDVSVGGTKKAVFDIFRIEDGKLAEHWDAIEDQPENTASGLSMTGGSTEIANQEKKDENKRTVTKFYEIIWTQRDISQLPALVHTDIIQHTPEIEAGIDGLRTYFDDAASGFKLINVHRVIGEGNFVLAQLEIEANGETYAYYDLHRLDSDKIAEQWRVKQKVPTTMAHENGMF